MVILKIYDEDEGKTYNITFPSKGTFYELAAEIKKNNINLPELFNLITESKKLKTNETYNFKENQLIKIRDVEGLESYGMDFTDLTVGKIKLIGLSNKAPEWRKVNKGINLFGICECKNCKAYNKEVIHMIKENKYSLTENNGLMKCPICENNVQSKTVGFFNCYYNYYGIKYDEDKDETIKFGVEIPNFDKSIINDDNTVIVNGKKITIGKTPKDMTNYFSETDNKKIKFIKLIFQVKKF